MTDWRRERGKTVVFVPPGEGVPIGTVRGSIFDAMTPAMLDRAILLRRRDRLRERRLNWPEPGHWLIRFGRDRPAVPACIRWVHTTHEPGLPENPMERSPFLAAFIIEEPAGLDEVWDRKGEPITEAEHRYHVDNARWAKAYAPREAIARPRQRVDWSTQPPPF
jgi:hypothetical protein